MREVLDQASQASPRLAQRYADGMILGRAVPVVPLAPGSKIPLIATRDGGQGVLDATCDVAQIELWWSATPDANIGLGLAGARLVVLDIEGPNKGVDPVRVVEELAAAFGALPVTRTAITAGGGSHHYYGMPDGRRPPSHIRDPDGQHIVGCERRRSGQYVVAPGSRLGDGTGWAWANEQPVVAAPEWLAGEPERPRAAVTVSQPRFASGSGTRRGLAALEHATAAVCTRAPGAGRHAVLVAKATWLFELALAGHLDPTVVVAEMRAAARAAGLPRDNRLDADGRDEIEAALEWAAERAMGAQS